MSKSTFLKTLFHGMGIGIANIIPGVSGGTLAVIFQIYDRLLSAISGLLSPAFIKSFLKKLSRRSLSSEENNIVKTGLQHLRFLTCIFLGAGLGIILFAKIITYLLSYYSQWTLFFFIGLILGSIPLIYRSHQNMRVSPGKLVSLATGILLLLSSTLLPESSLNTSTLSPINFALFFALSGFIAAASMVIPGISGSLVLLILGSYQPILQAVSSGNLTIISWVGLGAIFGIILTSKGIDHVIKKYPGYSYYFIMGLLIGSVVVLYPGISINLIGLVSVLCAGVGFVLAMQLGKK